MYRYTYQKLSYDKNSQSIDVLLGLQIIAIVMYNTEICLIMHVLRLNIYRYGNIIIIDYNDSEREKTIQIQSIQTQYANLK